MATHLDAYEDLDLDVQALNSLAGGVASEVFFGHICGDCSNDLRNAIQIIEQAVVLEGRYGLEYLNPKGGYPTFSVISESAEKKVHEVLHEYHERALNLLTENQEKVRLVAERLKDKGYILRSDIREIMEQEGVHTEDKKETLSQG